MKKAIIVIATLLCVILAAGPALVLYASPAPQKGVVDLETSYGDSGVITSVYFDYAGNAVKVRFREPMHTTTFGMGLNFAKTWTKAWSDGDKLLTISNVNLFAVPEPAMIIYLMQTEADRKDISEPNIFVARGAGAALKLTTGAHLVKAGDYFTLNAAFDAQQDSNAAILAFTFDGTKFEYAGFTAAAGVQVMNTEYGDGFARLTLISMAYDLKNFGDIMLRAKEDAVLATGFQTVSVSAQHVILGAGGVKEIMTSIASARFTTLGGGGGGGPAIPGDTNFDGVLDLIDLSNMIDWFGKDASDADWDSLYTFFDFNNNGEIDISDIAYVAQRI